MRSLIRIISLAVLFAPLVAAQTNKIEATNLLDHPFQVDFPAGHHLRLYLRSGDVRVVGKEDNKISVRVEAHDADRAREVRARYERWEDYADLTISRGPRNNIRIIVEVPKTSGLFVRMSAGQLEIEGVTGDKDAQLHFGEMILHIGDPADYSHVDASVSSGGLEAPPFGEDHGGLFRSFEKSGNGKYRLHAHVGAGDLSMR